MEPDYSSLVHDCEALSADMLVEIALKLQVEDPVAWTSKQAMCQAISTALVQRLGHRDLKSGAQVTKTKSRQVYKTFLKWLYRGFKVLLGTAGTVVSFGAGGDTIPDVLFTIVDAGVLAGRIGSVLNLTRGQGIARQYVETVYNLKWDGDPALVKSQMDQLFSIIDRREGAEEAAKVYAVLCEKYLNILDSFAALLGSLVSTMIPDDAGAARLFIETLLTGGLKKGGTAPFTTMSKVFSKIPPAGREILSTPDNFKEWLVRVVYYAQDQLPNPDDPFWKRAWKHVKRGGAQHLLLPLIPGGALIMPAASVANLVVENPQVALQVRQLIDEKVVPNLDTYVALVMRALPMAFAVTILLEKCSEK